MTPIGPATFGGRLLGPALVRARHIGGAGGLAYFSGSELRDLRPLTLDALLALRRDVNRPDFDRDSGPPWVSWSRVAGFHATVVDWCRVSNSPSGGAGGCGRLRVGDDQGPGGGRGAMVRRTRPVAGSRIGTE
jgi:hypothetical protein